MIGFLFCKKLFLNTEKCENYNIFKCRGENNIKGLNDNKKVSSEFKVKLINMWRKEERRRNSENNKKMTKTVS